MSKPAEPQKPQPVVQKAPFASSTSSRPATPDFIETLEIPGGCFERGTAQKETKHTVCVDSFRMGKYEITQRQWQQVMGNNPSQHVGENKPVDMISWDDVQKFIQKLNTLGFGTYRLPTEAEWEYAARGGKNNFYAGTNDIKQLGEYAWFSDNSQPDSHPVGQKKPNEYGLYDMTGNVSEWVSDWYAAGIYTDYAKSGSIKNPTGPDKGNERVKRGGGFGNSWSISHRSSDDSASDSTGFRLVRIN